MGELDFPVGGEPPAPDPDPAPGASEGEPPLRSDPALRGPADELPGHFGNTLPGELGYPAPAPLARPASQPTPDQINSDLNAEAAAQDPRAARARVLADEHAALALRGENDPALDREMARSGVTAGGSGFSETDELVKPSGSIAPPKGATLFQGDGPRGATLVSDEQPHVTHDAPLGGLGGSGFSRTDAPLSGAPATQPAGSSGSGFSSTDEPVTIARAAPDWNASFTPPAFSPDETSVRSEIGAGLARGVLGGAPQMVGKALQAVSEQPAESKEEHGLTQEFGGMDFAPFASEHVPQHTQTLQNVVTGGRATEKPAAPDDFDRAMDEGKLGHGFLWEMGQSLRNVGEQYANLLPANPEGHGKVVNALAAGAEMLGPMAVPMVLGFVPGLEGPALDAAISATAGGLFGASQAQDTYEKGLKQGLDPAKAMAAGWETGGAQAGLWTVGMGAVNRMLGVAGKMIAGATGKSAIDGVFEAFQNPSVLKSYAKNFVGSTAVLTGMNAGSAAATAAIEQHAGMQGPSPWEAAKETIGPSLAMSALLGPIGLARYSRIGKVQGLIARTLEMKEAPADLRVQAAQQVTHALATVDPEFANSWGEYALNRIAQGKGVVLSQDALHSEDAPPAPEPAEPTEHEIRTGEFLPAPKPTPLLPAPKPEMMVDSEGNARPMTPDELSTADFNRRAAAEVERYRTEDLGNTSPGAISRREQSNLEEADRVRQQAFAGQVPISELRSQLDAIWDRHEAEIAAQKDREIAQVHRDALHDRYRQIMAEANREPGEQRTAIQAAFERAGLRPEDFAQPETPAVTAAATRVLGAHPGDISEGVLHYLARTGKGDAQRAAFAELARREAVRKAGPRSSDQAIAQKLVTKEPMSHGETRRAMELGWGHRRANGKWSYTREGVKALRAAQKGEPIAPSPEATRTEPAAAGPFHPNDVPLLSRRQRVAADEALPTALEEGLGNGLLHLEDWGRGDVSRLSDGSLTEGPMRLGRGVRTWDDDSLRLNARRGDKSASAELKRRMRLRDRPTVGDSKLAQKLLGNQLLTHAEVLRAMEMGLVHYEKPDWRLGWIGKVLDLAQEGSDAGKIAFQNIAYYGGLHLAEANEIPTTADAHAGEQLAERLGRRIVWFTGGPGPHIRLNGFQSPLDPYTIFVNAHQPEHATISVIGHELLHSLRRSNEEIYQQLTARIVPLMRNVPQYKAWLAKALEYEGQRLTEEELEHLAHEEIAADFFGDQMMEPKFWNELFRDQPRSWIERIRDAVLQAIDEFRTRLSVGAKRGLGSERYFNEVEKVRTAMIAAFEDWVRAEPQEQGRGAPTQPIAEEAEVAGAAGRREDDRAREARAGTPSVEPGAEAQAEGAHQPAPVPRASELASRADRPGELTLHLERLTNGDWQSEDGRFEIEHEGPGSYWAKVDGEAVGWGRTYQDAHAHLQKAFDDKVVAGEIKAAADQSALRHYTPEQIDRVVRGWKELAKNQTAFRFPKSDAKTPPGIFHDMGAGKLIKSVSHHDTGDETIYEISLADGTHAHLHVDDADRVAYLHAHALKRGSRMGTRIYQAVLTWAHNNGYKLIPDPGGLTHVNTFRRTEQMLSAALRFGKTGFMRPHADQRIFGWIDEPKTQQDEDHNLALLALTGAENAAEKVEPIRRMRYNFTRRQIEHANGNVVGAHVLDELASSAAPGDLGGGRSTLARVLFTKALAEGGSGAQEFLAGRSGVGPLLASPLFERGALYSRAGRPEGGEVAGEAGLPRDDRAGKALAGTAREASRATDVTAEQPSPKYQPSKALPLSSRATRFDAARAERALAEAERTRRTLAQAKQLKALSAQILKKPIERQADDLSPQTQAAAARQQAQRVPARSALADRLTKAPDWVRHMPSETREALRKAGVWSEAKPMRTRLSEARQDAGLKILQGTLDQFAPVLKRIGEYPYKLLRMASSYDAGVEAALYKGHLRITDQGALALKDGTQGLLESFKPLRGEVERFLAWVAGHRAERLKAEEREHLFGDTDIAHLKGLNGKLGARDDFPDGHPGENRAKAYAEVLKEYNAFSKAILDIAERSGLVNGETRATWGREFYVPFYREAEDGAVTQPGNVSGMVGQYAFKELKGGQGVLHDLFANTVRNYSHLVQASLKNRAATETLKQAEALGIAHRVPEAEKGSVYVLANGQKVHYVVDDPLVLDAISSLAATPFRGSAMKALGWFRHILTVGTTVNPSFRIRHTIREQLTAIATNPISYNAVKGWLQGFRYSARNNPEYWKALAGGSFFRMGYQLEGNRGAYLKKLLKAKVDPRTIVSTPQQLAAMPGKLWHFWQEVGERSDSISRANVYRSVYDRMIEEGKSPDDAHFEASYAARDVLDYGLHGTWPAIRMITQAVPFMNARAQGLYKLGRGAFADPRRFAGVVGGITLATIALSLAYRKDPDFQAREEWDRDNFWAFRVGNVMYRIPKPFELGALATIIDRATEVALGGFEPEDRERFVSRLLPIVMSQLNVNPIPQAIFPAIELWGNHDEFTGRQIETEREQALPIAQRVRANTSVVARELGKAGVLSPVDIDWLMNAYFGWLGAHAVATVDLALRPAMGLPERPARRIDDYFVVGDFARELPAEQSRFVEQFYDHLKQVQMAFQGLRDEQAQGDYQAAAKTMAAQGVNLRLRMLYANVNQEMRRIGAEIRATEDESMDSDQKRLQLDSLYQQRNELAKRAEDIRAQALQQ